MKPEKHTIAFRPVDQKTVDAWESTEITNFYGFRSRVMSWFIKELLPILKKERGKFYTALHNNNLKLKIEYKDEKQS